ncbi:Scr1 family TA system antitoxin-like transcriptional regulator [Streptomyces millisiae]|uniref:Scr1 family TA system antitoxin-like transcriptional regulator n=1 Tax=Streptomyces millisiae TaxID=3075542 RepID=A0ABU2LWC7_9ACTN|nr:Scr1 family TA system antitoxin-like transcriptional regulator [Streptomyces sp. DSM 44918]MDT0321887.1 Scr1 family TA system antitoxin-like transcriptional regulator [Streptomyces sp. DSM 44918]
MLLGNYLAALRHGRDESSDRAGAVIGRSASTISRMEIAAIPLDWTRARTLLTHYGVPPHRVADVERLLSRPPVECCVDDSQAGWNTRLRACELQATEIRAFHSVLVPRPVRTAAYSADLAHQPLADEPLDGHAPLPHPRTGQRRVILLDEFILDRRSAEPQVMADQLDHLIRLDEAGAITVRIVPTREVGTLTGSTNLTELRYGTLRRQRVMYIQRGPAVSYCLTGCAEGQRAQLDRAEEAALPREESLARLAAASTRLAHQAAHADQKNRTRPSLTGTPA